ncbi:iron complex outermembrane recepter protein [Pedobacter steynii]|uniref:Iron complex outermembrane recepter protein n=1 Tax=Pedobacter steynii TaxID=430522 RepID=A0A1G9KBT0_9SPHI|nr:TonB-dependent receptor [Pedobacter steynii]NQX38509.1 TonB-dependent receptor [Pedobacter steynii]SDL47248.1 iron complex outermembrane recepter protein [Pedobacter steynii]
MNLKLRSALSMCLTISLLSVFSIAKGQNNPDQVVSITPKTLAVRAVFEQLSQQSGLNFMHAGIDALLDKNITLDPASGTLKNILNQLSVKSGLRFSATGNDIAVRQQSKGSINGTVYTKDGEPARLVTVTIRGLRSTGVDARGNYAFKNIPAGTYTVTATYVGLQTGSKIVQVGSAEAVKVDFVMNESKQDLKEVVVNGAKVNKYGRKESEFVARLPIANLENPQVYSVVRKELITIQMATTLDESYKNIPGAVVSRSGAGMPAVTARGFTTNDNIRNGMATWLKTNIDPVTVERVESIKGPSSTLFGSAMVSFGGLVNYVIKRPYETFGGEISYSQGSFDLSRFTADVNLPLNADKSLLFRVTGAMHKENSFQDQGFQNLQVVSPSLTYQVNDRLKLTLDADITRVKGTSSILLTVPTGLFNGKSFKDLPIDYKQSLIDNSLASQNQVSNNVFAQAEYKISENWKSQTNYAYSLGTYDQFNQFNYSWINETKISRKISLWMPDKWGRKQVQQNFTGDFKAGPIRNRLVVGLDYMSQYRQMHFGVITLDEIDLTKNIPNISLPQANNLFAALNPPTQNFRQDTYSVYASDLINFTDQFMAMLSLRADRFINKGTRNNANSNVIGDYKQTAYSPKLGLIYQPIKDQVSIFMNYQNGFKNLANATQPDGTISTFKPQQANQIEGGIKLDLFGKRLNVTLSYYNIDVKNSTRFENRGGQNFLIQDGTQRSKGVDFELIANPAEGLNIVAGYGYNENKYTKGSNLILGRRATQTPANVGNLWINYSVSTGMLKGFGLGVGGNYVSQSYFANTLMAGTTAGTFTEYTFILPSYTFIDAAAFYDQPKFRISLKANNIGNVKSWAIDGRAQKPSNYLAGIAFKF